MIGLEGRFNGFVEALDSGFSVGEFSIDFCDAHLANRLLLLLLGFLLVRHFDDLLSVEPTQQYAKSVN